MDKEFNAIAVKEFVNFAESTRQQQLNAIVNNQLAILDYLRKSDFEYAQTTDLESNLRKSVEHFTQIRLNLITGNGKKEEYQQESD